MQVIRLSQVSIEEKVRCFNAAFADYFLQINMTEDYMRERHRMARVDYEASFGVWADNQLCAFIFSGLGDWNGLPTIYNAGTGVIPAYRGRHLVSRIYETALPIWQAQGFRQTLLEVITDNEKAIRVYERVGFQQQRRFHVYVGLPQALTPVTATSCEIFETAVPEWDAYAAMRSFRPSWEYGREGIEAVSESFTFLHAYQEGTLTAYLILQPATGTIPQFGFRPQTEPVAKALFRHALSLCGKLRMLNVETTAPAVAFLESIQFPRILDQFELLKQW